MFVYMLLEYQNKYINKKIRTIQRNKDIKYVINPMMKTLALMVIINPSPISFKKGNKNIEIKSDNN